MNTELKPLLTTAVVTAGALALITLGVSFGLPITDTQSDAIMGVVTVAAPFIVWRFATNRVTANAKVVEKVDPATGEVTAGQANELPTGAVIRTLGASEGALGGQG